jgi:hypothetical protein
MRKRHDHTSVAFRLPRELHDRLKEAAGLQINFERPRSVSEVIRECLEGSLVAGDPETLRLTNAIANMARTLGVPWHKDPFSFAAFAAAIEELLTSYRPEGVSIPKPGTFAAVLFGPDASPAATGKTLAAMELGR